MTKRASTTVRYQTRTTIGRPISDVFARLADLDGYRTWMRRTGLLRRSGQTSGSPLRVGTDILARDTGATQPPPSPARSSASCATRDYRVVQSVAGPKGEGPEAQATAHYKRVQLVRGMVKSCGRRVLIDHAATLVSASS